VEKTKKLPARFIKFGIYCLFESASTFDFEKGEKVGWNAKE
jgi:hypothetical protein